MATSKKISDIRLPNNAIGSYAIIDNKSYVAVVKTRMVNKEDSAAYVGLNEIRGHKGAQIQHFWYIEKRTKIYGQDLYVLDKNNKLVKAESLV